MKSVLTIALALVAFAMLAPGIATASEVAPATTTITSAVAGPPTQGLAVDPFYGIGELATKAGTQAFCLCQIGVNCCGDGTGGNKKKCSNGWVCRCNNNNDCIQ
jgi:hypothetical protein